MSNRQRQNPLVEECQRLRKHVHPISEKYLGAVDERHASTTALPFVLLLGNHSSGKSSFINHLLGRPAVQSTGVAPTDDCFTVICPGEEDIDRNGPALVGDPDLGFSSLSYFGSTLVNHTVLKIRSGINNKDFMVVDSPGMIDSPSEYDDTNSYSRDGGEAVEGGHSGSGGGGGGARYKRGYDFENVCRWYAERADVILLFFDPDKPGTTGETLSVMNTALAGVDHKLFIIFNKADQFHKMHDFARAYGNLCWNLSKVINRKDMPAIYAMCTPGAGPDGQSRSGSAATDVSDPLAAATALISSPPPAVLGPYSTPTPHGSALSAAREEAGTVAHLHHSFMSKAREDLDEARHNILKEVFNCPRRRIDNEISRLTDSVRTLQVHCTLVNRVVALYRRQWWRSHLFVASSVLASVGLVVGVGHVFDWLQGSLDGSASGMHTPVAATAVGAEGAAAPSVAGTYAGSGTPSLRGAAVTPAPSAAAVAVAAATDSPLLVPLSAAQTGTAVSQQSALALAAKHHLRRLLLLAFTSKCGVMTLAGAVGVVATWAVYRVQHSALLATTAALCSADRLTAIVRDLYAKDLDASPTGTDEAASTRAPAMSSLPLSGNLFVSPNDKYKGAGVNTSGSSSLGHSGSLLQLGRSSTNSSLEVMCSKVVSNLSRRLSLAESSEVASGLSSLQPVEQATFWALERILLTDIPNLRRKSATQQTAGRARQTLVTKAAVPPPTLTMQTPAPFATTAVRVSTPNTRFAAAMHAPPPLDDNIVESGGATPQSGGSSAAGSPLRNSSVMIEHFEHSPPAGTPSNGGGGGGGEFASAATLPTPGRLGDSSSLGVEESDMMCSPHSMGGTPHSISGTSSGAAARAALLAAAVAVVEGNEDIGASILAEKDAEGDDGPYYRVVGQVEPVDDDGSSQV